MKLLHLALCLGLGTASLSLLHAEEGMWLLNKAPKDHIKATYGVEISDAWLEHAMKASVRFNSGGSGSFVSATGLVITNHHVASDALQKLSSEKTDYLHDGFYARSEKEEIPCVDLELNVLQSMEDVTARVNAAVPAGLPDEAAMLARRKVIAEIEKESKARTGLRSDVVTLYQGGEYHLYCYKRYTDVRLVFAPEQQAAFFGGDPDNFEFPRYNLDIALFRVYENGKPLAPEHFLKFSAEGAKDGEPVFVTGHPGRTERLLTVEELETLRDSAYPFTLEYLKRREVLLTAWSARSLENARRAKEEFFSIQNSRKVRDGGLAALQDPAFFVEKRKAQDDFLAQMPKLGKIGEAATAAFAKIAQAQKEGAKIANRSRALDSILGSSCESASIARILLRAGDELSKPNGERLREFTDARKESLELDLFSDKPIYTDLEILTLADSLAFMTEKLGFSDPAVQAILAGKAPHERASELILGTKVRDIEFRKKLFTGGAAAVAAAKDPLIECLRLVDAEARSLRKTAESLGEIKQQAHAAIGKARYALSGASEYPDATFTLRLSYGAVRGYPENGVQVPAITELGGTFERSRKQGGKEPFDLPERWAKGEKSLDPKVPFNFVSTCDIIGGNSGSPTINAKGEFVGIIFDGNIQSLSADFYYEDRQSRALSVHSASILECLRKLYDAGALAEELVGKQ
jgi:hypothetical protein